MEQNNREAHGGIRKILVLRGLQWQGSGKSTWANKWVNEDPSHRIRINCDDLRNMAGPYLVPERENFIWSLYSSILFHTMSFEYDIVVDNMNLSDRYINDIKKLVDEYNERIALSPSDTRYEIEVKDFFHIPLSVCIERDSKRERPVGELAIRNTYNRYKDKIVPWKYLN